MANLKDYLTGLKNKVTSSDKIAALKEAFSSDTAKKVGIGLGATALAGAVGGGTGVSALGSVLSEIKKKRDAEELKKKEAEKERNLMKIKKLKDDLEKRKGEAYIGAQEALKDKRLAEKMKLEFDIFGNEAKRARGGFASASDKKDPVDKLKFNPPAATIAGDFGIAGPDDKQKVIEGQQKAGINFARKILQAKPKLVGSGFNFAKQSPERQTLIEELKNKNLSGNSLEAAFRELQRQIAPGALDALAAAQDGKADKNLTYFERFSEAIPSVGGSTVGAYAGFKGGAAAAPYISQIPVVGPVAALAAPIVGGAMGFARGGDITEEIANYIDSLFTKKSQGIESKIKEIEMQKSSVPARLANIDEMAIKLVSNSGAKTSDEILDQLSGLKDYQNLELDQKARLRSIIKKILD